MRIQEDLSVMEVLSKNGLTIKTELSYRYKPVDDKVGYVHDDLGTGYHNNIIIPEIRSVTREVIGEYLPEELYSTKRETIEDEIGNFVDGIDASEEEKQLAIIRLYNKYVRSKEKN